jgi:hypothetical protein
MNPTRLALAAIVAWIVSAIYGFIVYGRMLSDRILDYPAIFRPVGAVNMNLGIWVVGSLLAIFAVTYIYAKGYEGGSGIQEGLRFGIWIGLFIMGMSIGQYVTMRIGPRLGAAMAVASFVQFVIVGITIGAVYKRN